MGDPNQNRNTNLVVKDHVPSLACPTLTSTNYAVWAIKMKAIFNVHKVWDVIDPGVTTDVHKNHVATALLFQALPEEIVLQIGTCDTTKAMWEAVKARHRGVELLVIGNSAQV